MRDPDALASTVREALHEHDFLADSECWRKLLSDAPHLKLTEVNEAASDIGSDMLIEAGLAITDDAELAWRRAHQAFMVGFLYGYSFETVAEVAESDENVVRTPHGNRYLLAGDAPDWIFFELLDKAMDALSNLADDPSNLQHKGAYHQAVDSLGSVLSNEETDAYWVVTREALAASAARKNRSVPDCGDPGPECATHDGECD